METPCEGSRANVGGLSQVAECQWLIEAGSDPVEELRHATSPLRKRKVDRLSLIATPMRWREQLPGCPMRDRDSVISPDNVEAEVEYGRPAGAGHDVFVGCVEDRGHDVNCGVVLAQIVGEISVTRDAPPIE
ncbi:hypothetical protein GCM10023320_62620 [Pseudonocardia adelaidensis]|uniref:Uncharacterized protein n=1 Tax=Pseudonocardia adelaidensis TaxID=648754 RepID=A0ABP9NUQ6_9PSEU